MNESTVKQLLEALAGGPVTEIYVGGTLETGLGIPPNLLPQTSDWRQLALRRRSILIEVAGANLFSVEVVIHPWEIDLVKVDRIEPRFELEDDHFGFVGILDMILEVGNAPCHVDRIELFTFSHEETAPHLASVGFASSTDYIFVHGWRIDGLRIGGSLARDAWLTEVGEQVLSTIIQVAPTESRQPTASPAPPPESTDASLQLPLPNFGKVPAKRD